MISNSDAGIAQLVEHDLAKVGVASSSLVSRSCFSAKPRHSGVLFFQTDGDHLRLRSVRNGLVAEWSCSGLQSRVRRFDSDPGLHCAPQSTRPQAGFFLPPSLQAPVARVLGCASFRIGPDGETGRRKGLKIPHPQGYPGSIPGPGTNRAMFSCESHYRGMS